MTEENEIVTNADVKDFISWSKKKGYTKEIYGTDAVIIFDEEVKGFLIDFKNDKL